MPEAYEAWIDAQIYSGRAAELYTSFKDTIFPLEKTRRHEVLDKMWNQIDQVLFHKQSHTQKTSLLNIDSISQNYISISGQRIDELWRLEDILNLKPQWSAHAVIPGDSDSDGFRPRAAKGGKKKPLAITAGNDSSDDSMPGLQSVSNTSDDDDDDDSDEYSDYESSSDGYNTEEEDEIRELYREAMDVAHEADWFDTSNAPAGVDPFLQEDREGNPFLKILGSLRGLSYDFQF